MSKTNAANKQTTKSLLCAFHKKEIEGFCNECQTYLCSSCMFSSNNQHKSHTLMNMKELSMYLRNLILDNSAFLKHEYLEDHEIGIRQAKGALIEQSRQLIKRIDKEVESLVAIIKDRRSNIVNEINQNLQDELVIMNTEEAKWKERQSISKKILAIQTDGDDTNVSHNMELIIEGMKELCKEVENKEYKAIHDYDINLKHCTSDKKLEIKDLIEMMESMFIIKEELIVQLPYKA